jgi:hypothetical protein
MAGLIDFLAPETRGFSIHLPGTLKDISIKSKRAQWMMIFVLFNPFLYSLFLFIPYLSQQNQELLTQSWYQTFAWLRWRIPLIGICGFAGLLFLFLSVKLKSKFFLFLSATCFLISVITVSLALCAFLTL